MIWGGWTIVVVVAVVVVYRPSKAAGRGARDPRSDGEPCVWSCVVLCERAKQQANEPTRPDRSRALSTSAASPSRPTIQSTLTIR